MKSVVHMSVAGFLVLIMSLLMSQTNATENNYSVDISTVVDNNAISFIPYGKADVDTRLVYKVTFGKSGSAGASQSQQSGEVVLMAGESKPLTLFSLNLLAGDTFSATVTLLKQGEVVAEKTVQYP